MRTEARPGPPEPHVPRFGGLFELLSSGRFGVLLSGNLVSALGTFVHIAVTSWVLFELTGSSAMVGVLTVAQYAPIVMLTLPAGILIDHRDRRRAMMATLSLQMTLAFLLAVLVWTGRVSPFALIAVTAGMGIGSAAGGPAWISLVGDLLPPERVMLGFSLNSVSFHLAAMLGPPLGAALLVWVGAGSAFAVNAATYLALLGALAALRLPPRVPEAFPGLRRAVGEMYRFARQSHRARRLLPVSTAIAVVAFGLPAVLPAYASDVLGGSAAAYGRLAGAMGAGSLVGAVLMGLLQARLARRTIIVIGGWVIALGTLGLAGFGPAPLALAGMVGIGAGQLMLLVTARTVIQMDAPEALRARAVSLWFMAAIGVGPLGGMALGWGVDTFGIRPTIVAVAVYSIVLGAVLAIGARTRVGLVTPYDAGGAGS